MPEPGAHLSTCAEGRLARARVCDPQDARPGVCDPQDARPGQPVWAGEGQLLPHPHLETSRGCPAPGRALQLRGLAAPFPFKEFSNPSPSWRGIGPSLDDARLAVGSVTGLGAGSPSPGAPRRRRPRSLMKAAGRIGCGAGVHSLAFLVWEERPIPLTSGSLERSPPSLAFSSSLEAGYLVPQWEAGNQGGRENLECKVLNLTKVHESTACTPK